VRKRPALPRPTPTLTGPPDIDLVTEAEYAHMMKASIRTVRRWDALGKGPMRIRLGRHVFYRKSQIALHIAMLEEEQRRHQAGVR
jgi:hypothetical protein